MKAYEQSLHLLRFSGRVVAVGIPEHDMSPIASANPSTMVSSPPRPPPRHPRRSRLGGHGPLSPTVRLRG